MSKQLRIYVATQEGCKPCELTMKALGDEVADVPVYEVDLSTNPERRDKMGVTKTPTLFIVEVEDTDGDGILEEIEEKHLWHQTGLIANKINLEHYVRVLENGGSLATKLS